MRSEETLLVKLGRCSLPDNTTKTLPFIEHTLGTPIDFPKNVDEILIELEESYDQLVQKCRSVLLTKENHKISRLIVGYMELASKLNVEIEGLETSLSIDLGIPVSEIKQYLQQYERIRDKITYVKKEYKRRIKKDPIKYAEAVDELVNIMGKKTVEDKTKIKRSTIDALRKVARMPKEIKDLISSGQLQLTIAFEIPVEDGKKQIKIARELVGLSQAEAKKKLRKLKEELKKCKKQR